MEYTLAEQLLLLSYDDVTGRPSVNLKQLDYGIEGALLLELSYLGRISLTRGRVDVIENKRTGDPHLDAVLARVAAQHPTRSADWWVYHMSDPVYRESMLDRLVKAGVLTRREHRVLGLLRTRAVYPEVDTTEEHLLVDHLRDIIAGTTEPDRRSLGLLALTHACELDRKLFPDLDRDLLRRRLSELTSEEWCGEAVRKVVHAMNMAVLAAVTGGAASSSSAAVPAT